MSLNQDIFLAINSFADYNEIVDVVMIFIAQSMPYFFIGLLFYLWFSDKKNEALFSGYSTILAIGINKIIGLFYFHPRPFMDNLGITLLEHKADNSFPSDHTTFLFAISIMLITFQSTRTLGKITTFLAMFCGITRIYSGVHYPFDILGAFIIALISVSIFIRFKDKFYPLNKIIIGLWNSLLAIIFKRKNLNE